MAKTRIIFRADGYSEIGLGHVMRSLALANMLKNDFRCEFATRFISDFTEKEIQKSCDKIHILPQGNNLHFQAFLEIITPEDIIVLDNYFFGTSYQKQIREKGAKLVCIDDMHDKHYVADAIINHAPGLRAEVFSTELYTRLCLGLDYALLRDEFYNSCSVKERSCFNHVLVCYGGSDILNLTCKTTNELLELDGIKKISVIISSAYQFEHKLRSLIECRSDKEKEIILYSNIDARKMVDVLGQVDFAIVPSSTILLEVISQRKPVISGYYTDNQKNIAANLKDISSSILIVDDLRQFTLSRKRIQQLKNSSSKDNTDIIISKDTVNKLLKEFKQLEIEQNIEVREATINDIDLCYYWVNDKDTRANSINSESIEYSHHAKWFENKLKDKQSKLYLFKKGTVFIGQVRFDYLDNSYKIDYSVDRRQRSKGFGYSILKLGIEELCKNQLKSGQSLVGEVNVSNLGSNKIFNKLGFNHKGKKKIGENEYNIFWKV